MKIEIGDKGWYVRLYNYVDGNDVELLPAGQARLEIECKPRLEERIEEVRRNMASSILDSDPASWL